MSSENFMWENFPHFSFGTQRFMFRSSFFIYLNVLEQLNYFLNIKAIKSLSIYFFPASCQGRKKGKF